MKKVISLWTALLLTAMPWLQAQNPVRNLKAEVERNRYVRLSWETPFADENAKAGEGTDQEASFEFWKKTIHGDYSLFRYGDTVVYPERYEQKSPDSTKIVWKWVDAGGEADELIKVSDTIRMEGKVWPNSAFMNKVGNGLYGVDERPLYRNAVYRFDMADYNSTLVFPIAGSGLKGMTYLPEEDGGKGALALLYGSTIYTWDMGGDSLDNLELAVADIEVPAGGKAYTIEGLAYYNGVYYTIGHHSVKPEGATKMQSNFIRYIDAFDAATGAYLGRKKSMEENVKDLLYFMANHLYVATDPKTNNTYLVCQAREVDENRNYITVLYYFEIATSSTVVEYDVKRNGTELTAADFKRTTFFDTLTEAGEYTYAVAARYGELNVSADEEVKVTIEALGECPAPTELTATVYNRNYVALSWQRPVREDAVKAERYVVSRDGKEIGVSAYAGYVDSVVPGTYTYTVRAEYTNSGVSAESAAVSATVGGKVAAYAPRELSAVSYIDDQGEGRVDLAWEAPYFGPEATASYSEMEAGGQVESTAYGMGVLYEKGDLAHLTDYAMDQVAFVLADAGQYYVVVYQNGTAVFETTVEKTGAAAERVSVDLPAPVRISADATYLVGVIGNIAMGPGKGITSDKSYAPVSACMSPLTGRNFDEEKTSSYPYAFFKRANPAEMTGNYNVEAHFTALHNAELEGGNSDFAGYAVYRNGEKLPDVLLKEQAYADQNLADGDYTYTVASVWKGGSDLQSNAVSKNVLSLYGAPDNFAGMVSVDTVRLSWQAPLSGAPVVKRWDSGQNAGKLGNKNGGIIYAASLFTPDDMRPFAGFSLTQVEFFLAERVKSLAVVIYNGAEKIYEQAVPTDKLKTEDFNIIALDRPVAFDAAKDLRVGYMVDYSANGRPVGVDATETADGKGNQISLDGKAWASASEQGVKNNFNIAFTLQYFNTKEVAAKGAAVLPALPEPTATVFEPTFETVLSVKVSKFDNNEFSGFNVYRNDEKLTAEPIKDLAYTDITADSGRYAYKVSAVYTLTDEMFSQTLTFDTKKPATGGDEPGTANEWDAQAEGVRIYPNPAVSTLYVSGAYDSFRLTDLYGRTVLPQTAAAPAIEVSGLPAGQYLLILTKGGRESVRKITVR